MWGAGRSARQAPGAGRGGTVTCPCARADVGGAHERPSLGGQPRPHWALRHGRSLRSRQPHPTPPPAGHRAEAPTTSHHPRHGQTHGAQRHRAQMLALSRGRASLRGRFSVSQDLRVTWDSASPARRLESECLRVGPQPPSHTVWARRLQAVPWLSVCFQEVPQ